MENDKRIPVKEALFFGALWGLVEMTLGHLLHYSPMLISGSVMFPIAVMLMRLARRSTGDNRIYLMMGLVAASLKLIDLLIPGLPPIKTINPALAILFEAAAITAVAPALDRLPRLIPAAAAAAFGWRAVFVLNGLWIDRLTPARVTLVQSSAKMVPFLLLFGSLSAVLTALLVAAENRADIRLFQRHRMRPVYALGVVGATAVLQFFF